MNYFLKMFTVIGIQLLKKHGKQLKIEGLVVTLCLSFEKFLQIW